MNEIKKIKGTFKSIIFESSTNSYKVISIGLDNGSTMTANGDIDIDLKHNVIYNFYGQEVIDNKYGKQLKVVNIETELYGEEAFLDIFKKRRIGTTKSKLINDIYKKLGDDAIAKIVNDTHILDEFKTDDVTKELIIDAIYDSAEYQIIENYLGNAPIDDSDRKKLHNQISEITAAINVGAMSVFEKDIKEAISNNENIDYKEGQKNLIDAFKITVDIISEHPKVLNYSSDALYDFDTSILDVIKNNKFDFVIEKPEEENTINENTKKIKGHVKKIIFKSQDDFKIIAVKTKRNGEITMKGNMDVNEGMNYTFHGTLTVDAKYGNQFYVEEVHIEVNSKNAMRNFLNSKEFKGVGDSTIDKIYHYFGLDAIDILLENRFRINEVPGISKKAKTSIMTGMLSKRSEIIIINQIDSPIASPKETKDIAKAINSLADQIDKDDNNETPLNEWELPKDIRSALLDGKIAIEIDEENDNKIDHIQTAINIFKYDPFVITPYSRELRMRFELLNKYFLLYNKDSKISVSRLESGIEWYTKKIIQQGFNSPYNSSTLFPIEVLLSGLHTQFPSYDVSKLINELAPENIKIGNNSFMLTEDYEDELEIAQIITDLIVQSSKTNADDDQIEKIIKQQEDANGFKFHDIQKEAIKEACLNKVFIVTGGPGTGKTTVAKAVIDAVCEIHGIHMYEASLCAPTGKAARRIKDQTGREATTIHSLLDDQGSGPKYGKDNKLKTKLLVIDEASMIDTKLMKNLLSAIYDTTRVIIIGDDDQLPSIGPGKVLNDMINAKEIPSVMLKATFRQGEGSPITELAIQVNNGIPLSVTPREGLEIKNVKATTEFLTNMVVSELEKYHTVDPLFENVQVLCSTNNIVDMINLEMQARNNSTEVFELPNESNKSFKVKQNDKVMCCRNDYGIDLCNGDIGVVTSIIMPDENQNIRTTSPIAIIEFAHKAIYVQTQPNKKQKANLTEVVDAGKLANGEVQIIKADQMPAMRLAYAVTIHKSQGSEWPNVILTPGNNSFGTRKLVYTGITRSKSNLTLIGDMSQIQYMATYGDVPRYTNLSPIISITINENKNKNGGNYNVN